MGRSLVLGLIWVVLGLCTEARALDQWRPKNGEHVILRMGAKPIPLITGQNTPLTKPITFNCHSPSGCSVVLTASVRSNGANENLCSYVDGIAAMPDCADAGFDPGRGSRCSRWQGSLVDLTLLRPAAISSDSRV